MADTKEIEIKLNADTGPVKKQFKDVFRASKDLEKMSTRMRNSGIKGHKELSNISKTIQKTDRTNYKSSLDAEGKLQRAMKKTVMEMKNKLKVFKGSKAAVQDEIKHLGRLERVYDKLKTRNRALGLAPRRGLGDRMRGAGMGAARGAGSMLMGAGGLALGAGAAGGLYLASLIQSQVGTGFSLSQQYGQAYGGLAGSGGRMAQLQRARGKGNRMGFGPIETATQARGVARATGQIGAVTQAQAAARTTMQDVSETTGFMGTLTRAGRGFGGAAGNKGRKDMQQIIAAGMAAGMDRSRVGEYMQSIGTLIETQAARVGGDVDVTEVNKLLMQFGRSGFSGLQGARGGAVMSQLDQSIRQPGGGEAGQAFMLRAFGFGKPGGTASFYQAKKRQQQGAFGEGNIQDLFAQAKSEFGGGEAQMLGLEAATGISLDTLEKIRTTLEKGGSKEEVAQILKEARPIEVQALDAMKEFGDVLKDMAKVEEHGLTVGEETRDAILRMREAINEFITNRLPLLVSVLERIATAVEGIFNFLNDMFGDAPEVARTQSIQDYNEIVKLKKEREAGDLSPEAYEKRLGELQQEAIKRATQLEEHGAGSVAGSIGEVAGNMSAVLQSAWAGDPGSVPSPSNVREREAAKQARLAANISGEIERSKRASADTALAQQNIKNWGGQTVEGADPALITDMSSLREMTATSLRVSTAAAAQVENLSRVVQGSGAVHNRRPAAPAADSSGTGQRAP